MKRREIMEQEVDKTLKAKVTMNAIGITMVVLMLTACSVPGSKQEADRTDSVRYKNGSAQEAEVVAAESSETPETLAESSAEEEGIFSASPKAAFEEFVGDLSFIQGTEADFVSCYVDYDFQTDYSNVQMGNVGYKIADFDNDGDEELLIAEVVDNSREFFSMYEYDGEVKLSDKYEIEDTYLSGDYNSTFCFLYDDNGQMNIGLYSNGSVYIAADGCFFRFIVVTYKDGSFAKVGEGGYAGSDLEEDTNFMQAANQCGIYVSWDDFCNNPELAVLKKTNGERMFKILVKTGNVDYSDGYVPRTVARHVKFEGAVNNTAQSNGSGYILANSSEVQLTESDLESLTKEELKIARNEIMARHGRKFKDEELQDYFDSQTWYNGTIEPDDFDPYTILSDVEMYNVELIKKYE